MGKKYSDEELIQKLKYFYEEHGQVIATDLRSKNNMPNDGVYIKRFGSLLKAKELAGIPLIKRKPIVWTKEQIKESFIKIVNKLGYVPTSQALENIKDFPSRATIHNYYNNYDDLVTDCGFYANKMKNGKYKKNFLISAIQRFVNEFHRVPTQKDFEKLKGYPSRKTFTNNFTSFNEVIRLAGFTPLDLNMKEKKERYSKHYLEHIINNYIVKHNKVPTMAELSKEVGFEVKCYFKEIYGGYNNALVEMKLPLNSVPHHDDEFLHSEFERFVKTHGRIPIYAEFNNSEYPSFWCYQNRFGSWNNAVIAYGYEPNDKNRKFYLDNGEICASKYEFDISTWLRLHGVQYQRNIKYKDFIQDYNGKMDCDYVFNINGVTWYVEMAGFLRGTDFQKFSSEEKNYFFKLKYKQKLLRRQNVKYVIIHPSDIKSKKLSEIFYFLNIKEVA